MTRLDAFRALLSQRDNTDEGHVITYDEKQISAAWITCAVCNRSFYMTDHKQTVCVRCRRRS